MKKKWLINLSTLVLCVCALAIGVYAAKQASLTASGQIGFNAHGCDVDVTTYIYGHSRNADTAPLTEAQKETLNTQVRGENTDLALNTLYFSDVTDDGSVPNIIIQMSFLNKSEFDVSVKVDLTNTTIGNSNVTIRQDKTSLKLTKGGTAQTITFTLTLKAGVDTFTSNANLKLKIDFAKYEVSYKSNITVNTFNTTEINAIEGTGGLGDVSCDMCGRSKVVDMDVHNSYADTFPYYIELGKEVATGNALKWLIVGVDNNGAIASLEKEDTDAFADKKMLDKNYYLLSEKVLYTGAESDKATGGKYGIAFQNTYTNTSASGYENASGKPANDYATSSIRQYLKGATVCREASLANNEYTGKTGTEVSFSTNYTITQAEYDLIQARSLYDMYSKDGQSTADLANESDKLWLLSATEFTTLFGNDIISCSVCGETVYSSARCAVQGTDGIVAYWWLRSPRASVAYNARTVYSFGAFSYHYVYNADFGVRPALKLA